MARALAVAAAAAAVTAAPLAATNLRVEYLTAPINIEEAAPRFSYILQHTDRAQYQTAYQLSVWTFSGSVAWDSGKVSSNSSQNIVYAGAALTSDSDYTWSVTYWDAQGQKSPPAAAVRFSTALLNPVADFGDAAWFVGASAADNMLRTEFALPAPVSRARLYIFGMGYWLGWMNGMPVDNHVLGPFTEFERHVTYDAVDVTNHVHAGCNAFGLMLGAGWYAQSSVNVGPRSAMMMLSVRSAVDNTTTYYRSSLTAGSNALVFTSVPGPVLADDIYDGEQVDARKWQYGWDSCGFTPAPGALPWLPAKPTALPKGSYSARTLPVTIDENFDPVNITEPAKAQGQWVFDFGQTGAFITTFRLPMGTPAGVKITFAYAEMLHPDGTIYNQFGNGMTASYITSGVAGPSGVEEYRTMFTFYGCRYVQVAGFPGVPDQNAMTAHFVHTLLPRSGSVVSDSKLVNQIQHATVYASLSNLVDIPSDCPQRERRGWLGDAQLAAVTRIYNHDQSAMMTKWLRDILDSQGPDGSVPDCSPWYGHGGRPGDPAWSAAYPFITGWISDYYQDDRIVERHYAGVTNFIEYEIGQASKDPTGLYTFSTYGDWASVWQGLESGPAYAAPDISAYHFIKGVDVAAQMASQLGNTTAQQRYSSIAAAARTEYQKVYFNAGNSTFYKGTPISQLMGLDLGGVIPAGQETSVVNALVSNLTAHQMFPGHNSGGIITTRLLFEVLAAFGRADVAYSLLLAKGKPSFSAWMESGATTLWEAWDTDAYYAEPSTNSQNHIMFGFGPFLFNTLGGINRQAGTRGWTNLRIAPVPYAPAVNSAAASLVSPIGLISSEWITHKQPTGQQGVCGEAEENAKVTLTCQGGGSGPAPTFTSVQFASFGTPTGDCGSYNLSTCNAATSASVVAAACVGKSTCTLTASNDAFGGDPCFDTVKWLRVQLGGPCVSIAFSINTVIPPGATAVVVLPIVAGVNPTSVAASEGNATIYLGGAFVPGVPGVTSAAMKADGLNIGVGSGSYSFALWDAAAPVQQVAVAA